jgi:hypothetical protein
VLFTYDVKDYKAWANGLKACGYATDPAYPQKLIRIIETYGLADLKTTGAERKETVDTDRRQTADTDRRQTANADRRQIANADRRQTAALTEYRLQPMAAERIYDHEKTTYTCLCIVHAVGMQS